MSLETAWLIGIPADDANVQLANDVASAAARAAKSEPGDRADIARFEALATRLEHRAMSDENAPRTEVTVADGSTGLLGTGPETWPASLPDGLRDAAKSLIAQQLLPVLVVDPHRPGRPAAAEQVRADEPAQRWAADDTAAGRRAVEARFRAQIAEALAPDAARRTPIAPSGVQNPVVTEILREFVAAQPGVARVDAPVEYRDGSKSAHPFPLRALALADAPTRPSLSLKFALLSIRHTEMDAVVDGAWLRNAEVSRPRPAAQTDDLVFEVSVRQLEALCSGETHVLLHMYQTGLETAVMGFYRAVTHHLLRFPGTLSVQPMYFTTPPRPRQQPQRTHTGRDGRRLPRQRVAATQGPADNADSTLLIVESSTFRKGTPWLT